MARYSESRRPYGLPADAQVKRVTLDMPAETHRSLRMTTYDNEAPMSDVLRALTDLWLRDAGVRKKVLRVLGGEVGLGPVIEDR